MRLRPAVPALLLVFAVLATGCEGWKSRQLWDNLVGNDKKAAPAVATAPVNPPITEQAPYPAAPDDTRPDPASAAAPGAPTEPAAAENLRPFDFPTGGDSGTANPSVCGFPGLVLPAKTKSFAAGSYSGRKLDFQIDDSGHQATQIDVAVNHRAEPVVLVLGAYEPTIWNIGWSSDSRIVAVLVSGYHRQVVAGLPKSVPTLVSTYDNKGACGSFYVSADTIAAVNPISQRVYERPVERVYLARDGRVVIGDTLPAGVALVTGNGPTPDSFRNKDAPLAGPAGIEDAVRKGLLREASDADARAWAQAQAALPANRDLPPVQGMDTPAVKTVRLHNAYVVLKPMRMPAGLYGAHSVTLFVPKGIPRPTGPLGHSRILDFNTSSCAGATCRME